MGLVVKKGESRDLALYVGVGFALLIFVFYMVGYHPDVKLSPVWTEFGAMTVVIFGSLLKVFWSYRRTIRLWACLLLLLPIHVGFLALLLRWPLGGGSWFITLCARFILEGMVLSVIVSLVVGPPALSKNAEPR